MAALHALSVNRSDRDHILLAFGFFLRSQTAAVSAGLLREILEQLNFVLHLGDGTSSNAMMGRRIEVTFEGASMLMPVSSASITFSIDAFSLFTPCPKLKPCKSPSPAR